MGAVAVVGVLSKAAGFTLAILFGQLIGPVLWSNTVGIHWDALTLGLMLCMGGPLGTMVLAILMPRNSLATNIGGWD